MSTTTVSPLRQRMVEDMSLRDLAPRTQEAYIRGCRKLAAFLRRSPDTATAEDIRLFQLHLAAQGVSICTRNRTMTGIAFLFRVTLRRPEIADGIEYIAEPQKIPLVLSPEEVRRLIAAAPGFKYRLLLSLTYGYPDDPGSARPQAPRYDGALHTRRHRPDLQGGEPARPAGQERQKGRAAQVVRGPRAASSSGGCGYPPRPRCRLA